MMSVWPLNIVVKNCCGAMTVFEGEQNKCKQELMPRQGVANETRGETHVEFWSLKIKE